ncbi:MAG: DUF6807 family protein [Planctomycetaceae bacterium]
MRRTAWHNMQQLAWQSRWQGGWLRGRRGLLKKIVGLGVLLGLVFAGPVGVATSLRAEEHAIPIRIAAGPHGRTQVPVRVPVELPAGKWVSASLRTAAGATFPAQLTAPSLAARDPETGGGARGEVCFLLPELAAEQELAATITLSTTPRPLGPEFAWLEGGPGVAELRYDDRPVMRAMLPALDESTPEKRAETYKPYHHLFDATGQLLLTKGPGGLFPHHRGLFYGFNKIRYGTDQGADTWHCNKGEFQSTEGIVAREAGPVVGGHRLHVAWHGRDGAVFADELRELTAWNTPRGVLIEIASRLTSRVGPIELDGDPQHAGFQFRATQRVPDETKDKTRYLRPDGLGEPGQFRNWPDVKTHVNLPWHALLFVVGNQDYSACFVDHPQNPKDSRFSERDYGRFGSYFETRVDTDRPLFIRYRFWLQSGALTAPQAESLSRDFVTPPVVTGG